MNDAYPNAPSGVFTLFGILALVQLGCVVGLWLWQRWAIYGWLLIAFISLILNIIVIEIFTALVSFIFGTGIFIFVLRDKWQTFK